VLTHPNVYSKLLATLEDRIDTDSLEYDQVKNIPYLDATIDEGLVFFSPLLFAVSVINKTMYSLRCHATTAIGLHRSVPEGGAVCCGRYFPAGVR